MFCPNCGEQLDSTMKFCPSCGSITGFDPVPEDAADEIVRPDAVNGTAEEIPAQKPAEESAEAANTYGREPEPAQNTDAYGREPEPAQNTDAYGREPEPAQNTDAYGKEPEQDVFGAKSFDEEEVISQSEPVAPPKKKRSPLPFIIIGVAVLAVIIIAAVFLLRSKDERSAVQAVIDAGENTREAIVGNNDIAEAAAEIFDEDVYGIKISVKDINEMYEDIAGESNDVLAEFDPGLEFTTVGDKDGNGYSSVSLDIIGTTVDLDCYVTASESMEMVLSALDIFDDQYGMKIDLTGEDNEQITQAMEEALGSFGITAADMEQFAIVMGMMNADTVKTMKLLPDQLKQAAEEAEGLKIDFEKTTEEINIEGEDLKCNVYRAPFDSEKIAAYIDFIYGKFEENGVEDVLDKYLTSNGLGTAAEIKDAVLNAKIEGTMEYDVYEDDLAAFKIKSTSEEGQFNGTLSGVFGKDPENSSDLTLTLETEDGNKADILYKTEKAGDDQAAEVTIKANDEEMLWLAMSYNSATKECEVIGNAEGGDYSGFTCKADIEDSGNMVFNEFIFNIAGTGEIKLPGLTVELRKDLKVETCNVEYKDFSELDTDALLNYIISNIDTEVLYSLM